MTTAKLTTLSLIKAYFEALRPKTLTASLVPVLLGTFIAPVTGENLKYGLMFSVLFSALFIQIGTNLVNDAFDKDKGADTENRLGPIRLIQKGLISSRGCLLAGSIFFALALLVAIPFLMVGGLPFIGIVVLSIICGWCYTGGPYPLAYRGLADMFVIVFFGPVLTASAYYFQAGYVDMGIMVVGFQIGLLATALLVINNLRDVDQDRLADKRTIVVRFGETIGKGELVVVILLPYVLNFYWNGINSFMLFLPLFTFPMAFNLIRGVYRNRPSRLYNRFLQDAALLHLCFGSLLTIGARVSLSFN